ncbi:peptide/nickel transport system substrate-binding protein [Rhizobium sp. BK226]|jgi:peptide/nickel transport system substrate-binding protein|uniref:ABC transporter substrate-binding protein n=1 Tax=Rhizobium TaxID=379 RepID=UPI0007B51A95|nr:MULTISPECIES: ABC transporter substrate-binding protein [Rhizobium]KZS52613.1 peptide ABC transporter substrate-binding protein [Rhizobium anhuiense bv. trifolii]MBB4111015.1 peptide/nickel transport system substrate-binding protein [Rhizobium sp. BK226]MBB4249985.1 peptide/nickel transport system substrate-binding protein [Rhizobium sp. BK008]PDS60667.1 peptide ABC transporter substrate-binding protein [Rhizobium anhuiense]PDS67270.1 peptide ABC transporter substrate-binding protein [Rhizo
MIERFSPFSLPRRRLLIATSALAIAALVVTAEFNPALSADSPHNGGDITFLIDSLGDTWIPNNSAISSFQGHIWGHVTDKLLYVDADGKVSPWIAERWEQNDKATEFTLHLKSGVTFSDGTPLDASAVVANLDIWYAGRKSEGINPIGLFPKTYDHAEAVDAATVKVFFKAPTLGFIPTLGYHGSILISPKTLAQPAAQQADLSKTAGSGPYVVDSWKEGDFVKLVKRKDYNWGPAAVGHTGPAYLDTITYKLVSEPSLRVAAVQSGQADVAYNASPQELESLKTEGFTTATPRYLGFVNGWAVNTKLAPYDDVKVRQALQAGINRQEIIDTVYTPDWKLATSFIQSNVPGATDQSALLVYNPEKAEKLLDEAGWTKGADGIRTKNGQPLVLTLHSNPYLATSKSVDELIAQQLGKIGWKVAIRSYDVVTYGQKVKYGSPAVPAYEVTRSFIDAGTVASILTNANNGENWFALDESDKTLNELRDKIASAGSIESRKPLLDELQKYILDQGYFIPRTQIVQRIYVQSPKLKGEVYNGVAYASYYTATKSE